MSVKKYIISKKQGNFTTIPNKVLQGIKNIEALGLWVYLASLPCQWEFHKEQLREHFSIGIHKLNFLLRYLEKCSLVRIAQIRDSKGKFSYFDMAVDDGSSFEIKDLQKLSTPCYRNRITETVRTDISSYKGNTNKLNKEKEKREKRSLKTFYPNEQNKILCKDLKLNLEDEIKSFNSRHTRDKTDYEFERWLKNSYEYTKRNKNTQSNEIRCTVPEYGPGHPRWEAIYGEKGIMSTELSNEKRQGRIEDTGKLGSNSMRKAQDYLL